MELGPTHSVAEMILQTQHLNFRKYIHGSSVVTLADTTAGYGTYANLSDEAKGFTTIELKCNFTSAVQSGTLL